MGEEVNANFKYRIFIVIVFYSCRKYEYILLGVACFLSGKNIFFIWCLFFVIKEKDKSSSKAANVSDTCTVGYCSGMKDSFLGTKNKMTDSKF